MSRSTGALLIAVLGSLMFTTGCSSGPRSLRRTPPKVELRPCGNEKVEHGEGYDAKARDCIWKAYVDRELAEFKTTHFTIEGDPISYKIQINPNVTVTVDNQDRYGQKGVSNHTCQAMERIRQEKQPERFGFALSGCTGGGMARLAVP
ncbi:hypothetical protein [Chondromyces crocatus]|uniref:Lipoprotein n=1 Tax=Chondromyces crocatus TaxID=52 RepID=A0A0K1E546_CHOCO|nr:hypothetical protein [Chondromyces crocatus]AKT35974.1 uncharacterized protein CMC5_000860 [Chondromyces crocatus]